MPKARKETSPRLTPEQIVELLVEAATMLLAEEGPSEIKARSVTEAAGVSTTAVYYHLGGLPELLQAVVDKGFRDLSEAFAAVPVSDDPVTTLFEMALATRQFAQNNPHRYDLMFGLSTRGSYRPPQTSQSGGGRRSEEFQAAYAQLVVACARLTRSGRVRTDEDPEAVAFQLWSSVHGFVTLELGGHFVQFRDPVREVLQPMMVNVFVGLGDTAELAEASHSDAVVASHASA
ncbi:TetR/AcrR family transcriptional regulator [Mycobacterium sp. 360MFTsu5.1]|uniref:TetR/AcrR family transcriptional regulator n=1 Tax=Mycobacterium sp. 360MFTsu5.1 TaxID=1172186 RepID=UPI00038298FC|nr:TetR/AcrR family transcriptional regulator [Mycobacterium sp. 360MFTsu5.1]